MNQLLLTNKTLTLEKEALNKKMEQFKKHAQKVPSLEQQLKEQQELATEREKKRLALIREKSELEDKEYNLSNRLKQLEARLGTNEKQLLDTIAENEELQGKLTKANKGSFLETNPNSTLVGDTGESLVSIQMSQDQTLTQSIQLVNAERERDLHKWKSERLVLEARMHELNASLKQKDEDSIRREYRMRKKHEEELEQAEEGYGEQFDEMQAECNKAKNANMFHENNLHQLKLEHEKTNRLLSSSFYHLGLV